MAVTFDIHKLNFLETKLKYNSSKFSETHWNAYFDWHFEASQYYQESKTACMQSKF